MRFLKEVKFLAPRSYAFEYLNEKSPLTIEFDDQEYFYMNLKSSDINIFFIGPRVEWEDFDCSSGWTLEDEDCVEYTIKFYL